jgi:hypothetical protein
MAILKRVVLEHSSMESLIDLDDLRKIGSGLLILKRKALKKFQNARSTKHKSVCKREVAYEEKTEREYKKHYLNTL